MGEPRAGRRLAAGGWWEALRGERGTGVVGALAGVAAFLGFLLLASHTLVHLYATSVATAAAYDAARIVAGAAGGPGVRDEAVAHARGLLGGWGKSIEVTVVRADADAVAVRVRGRSPLRLPALLREGAGLGVIDRTVRVRTERWVGAP